MADLQSGLTRVPLRQTFVKDQAQFARDRLANRLERQYLANAAVRAAELERQRGIQAANSMLRATQRQVIKSQVTNAVRPLAAVGSRGVAAVTRIPVAGPVLQRVVPTVFKGVGGGPGLLFLTVSAVMQIFAPTVQGWLLGGWRGGGNGKLVYPQLVVGSRSVGYLIQYRIESTAADGSPNPLRDQTLQLYGPIGIEDVFTRTVYGERGWTGIQLQWYSVAIVAPVGSSNRFGLGQYFKGAPGNSFTYTITPLDGQPEGGTDYNAPPTIDRPDIVKNPSPSNPKQVPSDPAQPWRDVATALALGTIAAGQYKPVPNAPPNPANSANTGTSSQTSGQGNQPPQPPSTSPCRGNACGQAALDKADENSRKLDDLLDKLTKGLIAQQTAALREINEKLGPQLYDQRGNKTGLAGAVNRIWEKLNSVGDYLRVDRILNALTLITTVHNATMLSRNLADTLMYAISNGLAVIGIKDDQGNPLDIASIVGKSTENLVKGIIGTENYTELTINWKRANRIYQASANLLNNIQSLRYSITGALETIGGWNAKIGNALKRYGVLGDNAYPWMNPSPNFDNKFMRGLETVENVVSQVDSVSSEILSAQETVTEITRQKTELEQEIKTGTEKPGVDNDQQKAKAEAAKVASQSPDINPIDTVKPGGV
jgi:hypothetical protein